MFKSTDGRCEIKIVNQKYVISIDNIVINTLNVKNHGYVQPQAKPVHVLFNVDDPTQPSFYYSLWSDGHIDLSERRRRGEKDIDKDTLEYFKRKKAFNPELNYLVTGCHYTGEPNSVILAECLTEDEAKDSAYKYGDRCCILNLQNFYYEESWANR